MLKRLLFLGLLLCAFPRGGHATCANYATPKQRHYASASTGATTSAGIVIPNAINPNDVCVVGITWAGTQTVSTVPSGWTLIGSVSDSSTITQKTYWATARTPGATDTFTLSGSVVKSWTLECVAFVNAVSPIDTSAGQTTSGTTHAAPTVTTALNNEFLVAVWGNLAASTWTAPADMTLRATTAGTGISGGTASGLQVTAGATGSKTGTGTSGTGAAQLIALTPACLVLPGAPQSPGQITGQYTWANTTNSAFLTVGGGSAGNRSEQLVMPHPGRITGLFTACSTNAAATRTIAIQKNSSTSITSSQSTGQRTNVTRGSTDYAAGDSLRFLGVTNNSGDKCWVSAAVGTSTGRNHYGMLTFGGNGDFGSGILRSCGPTLNTAIGCADITADFAASRWKMLTAGTWAGIGVSTPTGNGGAKVAVSYIYNITQGLASDLSVITAPDDATFPALASETQCTANCTYNAGDDAIVVSRATSTQSNFPSAIVVEYDSPQMLVGRDARPATEEFANAGGPFSATNFGGQLVAVSGAIAHIGAWTNINPGNDYATTLMVGATGLPATTALTTTVTTGQLGNTASGSVAVNEGQVLTVDLGAPGSTSTNWLWAIDYAPSPDAGGSCCPSDPTQQCQAPTTSPTPCPAGYSLSANTSCLQQ